MALKILVADHSESISRAIHLSLEDFAVKVQSFIPDQLTDAQSKSLSLEDNILKAIYSFNPSLIFLDTLLAKINGYEIAKTLKSDERFKDVPIILMYSSIMGIDKDKFHSSEANAILEKPFTQEKLRSVVTKCLKLESPPLGPIGEEIELPPIEDLKENIVKQKQETPFIKDKTFKTSDNSNQVQNSDQEASASKINQQPEGLISSDIELKELQKSLSELDGEEDFQQVNLFPSTSNKLAETVDNTDHTSNTEGKSKHIDTHPQKEDLKNKDLSKTNTTFTSSLSTKGKLFASETTQNNNKTSTSDTSASSKIQDKSPDDAFRLKIFTEDIMNDEVTVNVKEPEEEMTRINFVTTSQAQQTSQSNTESVKKEIISSQEKEEIHKDTHQADIEQKTQMDSSKEDMKKLVREEVRRIAQDQIQRTLNKELPDLAKKLIKAEITRLLSEYK